MALIGNCTHTTYRDHETETETTVVTFNDGSTDEFVTPRVIAETTEYSNVYLSIKQIDHFHHIGTDDDGNTVKTIVFHYRYAAYESVSARAEDQENFLFSEVKQLQNYNHESNLYEQIYNEIKTIEGLTNLVDA